jgi:hypothetical protein
VCSPIPTADLLACLAGSEVAGAQGKAKLDAASEVFTSTNVWRIQIEIPPGGVARLRATHWGNGVTRPTVKATIHEGGELIETSPCT